MKCLLHFKYNLWVSTGTLCPGCFIEIKKSKIIFDQTELPAIPFVLLEEIGIISAGKKNVSTSPERPFLRLDTHGQICHRQELAIPLLLTRGFYHPISSDHDFIE